MNKPAVRPLLSWAVLGRTAVALVAGLALLAAQGCGGATSPLPVSPGPADTAIPRATAIPTQAPLSPDCTAVGQTWTRPADGMEMVCVPAGEFLMGSAEGDWSASNIEKPQHEVYLDAYWIDKTEVTNAQYRRCVEAGACREPIFWDRSHYTAADQPVVRVTWDRAAAYCAWAGGALPTEAQWEKAARGTDGRIYPWGDTAPTCDLANYGDCAGRPAFVGSYPGGASPYGALDMAGNVWEWVADWYDEGYYARSPATNPTGPATGDYRVLRGGAWRIDAWWVRAASRYAGLPTADQDFIGFRCVVPAPGTP